VLFFEDGGVAPDAATGPADGAPADANDAGELLVDAGGGDESTDDGGCPMHVPASASVCCGSVACNGNCTSAQCSVCEMQCGPATLCCAKTNNVACRPMGSPCP
jgi:hypothetical protein